MLMNVHTDSELYARGVATMLAAWEAIARGSVAGAVLRLDGVAAGVFSDGPERAFYNNALLERDLGSVERARAVEAMEAAYADNGVEQYAAWVHESDAAMRDELRRRGYRVVETTRVMGMSLDAIAVPAGAAADAIRAAHWQSHVDFLQREGVPDGLLTGVDPEAFHVLAGSVDGEDVATGIGLDHEGDFGIFNVGTFEHARGRGLGTALTARLVHDAAARGCTTATLQSTPIAERVYAAVGFRDLGRFLEHSR